MNPCLVFFLTYVMKNCVHALTALPLLSCTKVVCVRIWKNPSKKMTFSGRIHLYREILFAFYYEFLAAHMSHLIFHIIVFVSKGAGGAPKSENTTGPMDDIVQMDILGPFYIRQSSARNYIISRIDDCSRKVASKRSKK
jgi:hypothetical protein